MMKIPSGPRPPGSLYRALAWFNWRRYQARCWMLLKAGWCPECRCKLKASHKMDCALSRWEP